MPTTLRQVQENAISSFMDGLCNCRFIITTPSHKRKDCPHYTWHDAIKFISSEIETAIRQAFEAINIPSVGVIPYDGALNRIELAKQEFLSDNIKTS